MTLIVFQSFFNKVRQTGSQTFFLKLLLQKSSEITKVIEGEKVVMKIKIMIYEKKQNIKCY